MRIQITNSIKVIVSLMLVGCQMVCAADQSSASNNPKTISVEIDYGDRRPSRVVEHVYQSGETVLEVLKSVAEVETHYAGMYNMVVAIDGIEGVRGDMGWYYRVDGEPAKQTAARFVPEGVKAIRWVYKTDVCSGKVDK